MAVKTKILRDLALLSGNTCAFKACSRQLFLVEGTESSDGRRLPEGLFVGECAHIKGEKPGSARYDPAQTDEERSSRHNLMLLCSEHHILIDHPETRDTWTVDILQEMKAEHETRVHQQSLLDLATSHSPISELVERLGAARTAFPEDLSFREHREKGLLIPTRLQNRVLRQLTVGDLLAKVVQRRNVVIIGQPGAGKSFTLFQMIDGLSGELSAGLVYYAGEYYSLGDSLGDPLGDPLGKECGAPKALVVVIDAADELGPEEVRRIISFHVTNYPAIASSFLITCRTNDFERHLSREIQDLIPLQEILLLLDWRPEVEFRAYVSRCHATGFLPDSTLGEIAEHDRSVGDLVRRPLYARMVCRVYEEYPGSRPLPGDRTALYGNYLHSLASRTARDEGLPSMDSCYTLWKVIAGEAFRQRHMIGPRLPASVVLQAMEDSELDSARKDRLVAAILSPSRSPIASLYEFLHYSFFEFLVAAALVEEMVAAFEASRPVDPTIFERDLSREMRLFARSLIRQISSPRFVDWYLDQYSKLSENAADQNRRRIALNLWIYFLRPMPIQHSGPLLDIYELESDPFIKNAILWTECDLGSLMAVRSYLRWAEEDPQVWALNRGYHLYYYADLEADVEPPYTGEIPKTWHKTRHAMVGKLAGPDYGSKPLARRAIDFLTFSNLASFFGSEIEERERLLLVDLRGALGAIEDPEIRHALDAAADALLRPRNDPASLDGLP